MVEYEVRARVLMFVSSSLKRVERVETTLASTASIDSQVFTVRHGK